jgi:hypothetical protein
MCEIGTFWDFLGHLLGSFYAGARLCARLALGFVLQILREDAPWRAAVRRAFGNALSAGYDGAHVGPPMDRAVLRVWDPLCASSLGKMGFGGGIEGNIFIF